MSKRSKRKIKLDMSTADKNDIFGDNCGVSQDICKPTTDPNESIVLNIINELNDLIIAKRDLIIGSFATKRGPIARKQIKDYLNEMTEIVSNKRNEILGSSTSSVATNASKGECIGITVDHNLKDSDMNSNSDDNKVSENRSPEETIVTKVTKTKAKTKSKSIQKSTKRRKSVGSVGRKGIGKLLFDYRNRNRIPDYQKRLKYVEKDPNIDILHKKIGLVSTRLSAIHESDEI